MIFSPNFCLPVYDWFSDDLEKFGMNGTGCLPAGQIRWLKFFGIAFQVVLVLYKSLFLNQWKQVVKLVKKINIKVHKVALKISKQQLHYIDLMYSQRQWKIWRRWCHHLNCIWTKTLRSCKTRRKLQPLLQLCQKRNKIEVFHHCIRYRMFKNRMNMLKVVFELIFVCIKELSASDEALAWLRCLTRFVFSAAAFAVSAFIMKVKVNQLQSKEFCPTILSGCQDADFPPPEADGVERDEMWQDLYTVPIFPNQHSSW